MSTSSEPPSGNEPDSIRSDQGGAADREALYQRALAGDVAAQDRMVELAVEGDRAARDHLLANSTHLFRQAARRVFRGRDRTPYAESDLVQSTIAKVLSALNDLEIRTVAGFVAFVRRLVANHATDRRRRDAVREAAVGGEEEAGANLARGPECSVKALATSDTGSEGVRCILGRIADPVTRRIVWLHGVVDLSHAEIARQLGPPWNEGSVGMRWRRAIRELRNRVPEP